MKMAGSNPGHFCLSSSLRANGSRERAPDDKLREAIQGYKQGLDCFVASRLAMTGLGVPASVPGQRCAFQLLSLSSLKIWVPSAPDSKPMSV